MSGERVEAGRGIVVAVCRSETHRLSKEKQISISIIAGLGVDGDAHSGEKVKHRSRVARNPDQPNLRQVHLIHAELLDELKLAGFDVSAGQMGENITTRSIDILGLPASTRLHVGATAVLEITGLRNPCSQLEGLHAGLMKAVLDRDENGNLIRKAGIMAIVITEGEVAPGDEIRVELPAEPHVRLEPV